MAIRCFKQKREVPINGVPQEKYVARMQVGEKIDFERISEMIAEKSTVSKGDILAVFSELETVMCWMMEEGNFVRFGDLGIFTPTAKVKAVDTEEKVTVETIQRIYTRFTPSVEMKKKMKSSKVIWKDK